MPRLKVISMRSTYLDRHRHMRSTQIPTNVATTRSTHLPVYP